MGLEFDSFAIDSMGKDFIIKLVNFGWTVGLNNERSLFSKMGRDVFQATYLVFLGVEIERYR